VEQPLGAALPEVVGARAQHQTVDQSGAPVPHHLRGDRPHRVAHDDDPVEAETLDQRGRVVGAVRQPETVRADAPPVPALVHHHDPEPAAEHLDRREPAEQPGAAERMQEEHGGCVARRPGHVDHVGRPSAGQVHGGAGGDVHLRKGDQAVRQCHAQVLQQHDVTSIMASARR
jgi:hypothetical protein